MVEKIKIIIAHILNCVGLLPLLVKIQLTKKNTIRIINYHDIPDTDVTTFENHLKYYKKHFKNITYKDFEYFKKVI